MWPIKCSYTVEKLSSTVSFNKEVCRFGFNASKYKVTRFYVPLKKCGRHYNKLFLELSHALSLLLGNCWKKIPLIGKMSSRARLVKRDHMLWPHLVSPGPNYKIINKSIKTESRVFFIFFKRKSAVVETVELWPHSHVNRGSAGPLYNDVWHPAEMKLPSDVCLLQSCLVRKII